MSDEMELARVAELRQIADDLPNGYVSGELRWAADEIKRLRDTVGRACEEFHMMPHVNGAVSDSTVAEVRGEASQAIDGALSFLHPLVNRPLTEDQRRLADQRAVEGSDQ